MGESRSSSSVQISLLENIGLIKMAANQTKEVLAAWETSSQYWHKHQATIEKMFAPLTQALIADAQVGSGQSVLDIGGGSGQPSLTIARIVGDSGSVIYTDPSAGMVRAARDEAGRRRLRNIQFHRSSAEHLPFPDNSFDAAVSRLAAMFFSDVSAALRDILRTLKPAGRISFVVWAAREINPFFSIVTDILNEFVPADVEEEDAPAAFRFAKPGKLASLLREAGAEVDERRLVFRIEAPINLEHFWELRTEMSDTFRRKIAKLSPVEVAAVKDAVQKAAARYFENDRMTFPAQALVVTGEKIKA